MVSCFKFSKKPLTALAFVIFFVIFFTAKYLSTRLDFPEASNEEKSLCLHSNSSVDEKIGAQFTTVINMPQTLGCYPQTLSF